MGRQAGTGDERQSGDRSGQAFVVPCQATLGSTTRRRETARSRAEATRFLIAAKRYLQNPMLLALSQDGDFL
jgi:hypothetical protein